MEVKFLGTGSMCSKRNCASLIIDKKILVDVGPGSIKQLIKDNYNLENINTILITHLHSDHILDFITLLSNLQILNLNHKIKIIGPINTKGKLLKFTSLMDENCYEEFLEKNFEFLEFADDRKELIINDYKIELIRVVHYKISYGFVINNRLGITGDALLCDGVHEIIKKCDVMVSDCSLINSDDYHMGFDNIKGLLENNKEKFIIATHLRESTRNHLSSQQYSRFIIADDGYCIEL